MIYLNKKHLDEIGVDWNDTINVIENAVISLSQNDFSQPIKPYLRYGDKINRIIAMPAFVGRDINTSGIKWIASFPKNIDKGIPRAHGVVILNEALTGVPKAVINTAKLSIIRTASVSGMMLKKFNDVRNLQDFTLSIIGWGPIGQNHYKVCTSLFKHKIKKIKLFDIRGIRIDEMDEELQSKIQICDSWEEAYNDADVFITCTVSDAPYINKKPKIGSLHLNISLRDYKVDTFEYFKDRIIVDDWDEVCREKTDIESVSLQKGLRKEDTNSIIDVVCNNLLEKYDKEKPIIFNPMGMAVFDISIGEYYRKKAIELNKGVVLE